MTAFAIDFRANNQIMLHLLATGIGPKGLWRNLSFMLEAEGIAETDRGLFSGLPLIGVLLPCRYDGGHSRF